MSYNVDAQVFETQIVIENTTQPAGVTSGSIINKGSLSTFDTYVTGHTVINNVKITPNLNDIIYEQQATLANNQQTYVDITDFYFDDSICNSFKALINVTVSAGDAKHAVWEINGLYKPSGWVITSSFTGDISGVQFSMVNKDGGIGQVQYLNTNMSGTTVIRYRATTTAPPGTTPLDITSGVITNTSGPFITNNLVYANSTNTLATTDILYNSNVLRIGGASRIVGERATNFVNFSNGGAITSMGDASVAKRMIVGEKIGVATTAPGYSLDISGDINFTGNFYKNGSLYSGSEIWTTNGTKVFYTAGNIGLGTSDPSHQLEVVGGIKSSSGITTSSIISTSVTSGSVASTNVIATNSTVSNILITSLSSGSAVVSGNATFGSNVLIAGPVLRIPTGDISTRPAAPAGGYIRYNTETSQFEGYGPGNAWGSLGGVVDIAQTTKVLASANPSVTDGNLYFYTVGTERVRINSAGNVGINTTSPTALLDVSGSLSATSITTSTINASTGITAGSAHITNANVTTVTVGTLLNTNAVSTNVTTATLNASTGITAASAQITNANVTTITTGTVLATDLSATNITVGSINNTNIVSTNVSSATLLASTGITAGSAKITNIDTTNVTVGTVSATNVNVTTVTVGTVLATDVNTTNITVGSIKNTNIVSTNITSATLVASTGITSASALITNIDATSVTASSLRNTDFVSTNVTTATLNASTGITAASAQISNANITTITAGTALATNISATTVTAATLLNTNAVSTNISTATLVASTGITAGGAQITNINATNSTITNIVSSAISSGNLKLSGDLVIGGTLTTVNITATNISETNVSAGTVFATRIDGTNSTITNAVHTSLSSGSISATNVIATNSTIGTFAALGGTIGGNVIPSADITYSLGSATNRWKDIWLASLYLGDKPLSLTGDTFTLEKMSVTSTVDSSSVTTGAFLVSGGMGVNGKIYASQVHASSGTVGSFVSTNVTTATLNASTGITAASAQITNLNATTFTAATLLNTNITSTNVTAATLNLSTGLTSASAQITNANITTITAGTAVATNVSATTATVATLLNTNAISTNVTAATLNLSTGVTAASAQITNANVTTLTAGTAIATNVSATAVTSATLNLSTGLTSASAQITNANVTTLTAGTALATNVSATTATVATLLNTNAVSTNVTAATLNLSTGVTSASAQITNANITTVTAGTLRATNILATTISAGTAVATTYTGASMSLSGDLVIGGTLTTVNITTTNVVDTNISTGTLTSTNITSTNITSATLNLSTGVTSASAQITNANVTTLTAGTSRITTSLLAIGNSNTIGNIFTTAGNVGIGTTAPSGMLHLNGSALFTSSGDLTCIGDITAFGSISDRRLKENIVNIPLNLALDKVKGLRPVTFTWRDTIQNKAKRGTTDAGFIAQEVEEVVEYAVGEFDDIVSGERYKKLNHERIIPYLVGAVQLLQQKIDDLESRLA